MGDLIAFPNRRARRARHAVRRREDRHEAVHACVVDRDARRSGVAQVRVDPSLYHDVHRVLGEPSCPRCPICAGLRRAGQLDPRPRPLAEVVLGQWRTVLALEAACR